MCSSAYWRRTSCAGRGRAHRAVAVTATGSRDRLLIITNLAPALLLAAWTGSARGQVAARLAPYRDSIPATLVSFEMIPIPGGPARRRSPTVLDRQDRSDLGRVRRVGVPSRRRGGRARGRRLRGRDGAAQSPVRRARPGLRPSRLPRPRDDVHGRPGLLRLALGQDGTTLRPAHRRPVDAGARSGPGRGYVAVGRARSEEHTSDLQSREKL